MSKVIEILEGDIKSLEMPPEPTMCLRMKWFPRMKQPT
jgi:hypothetical protein